MFFESGACMTLDFDLADELPWDFAIQWEGVRYPVRRPTAMELSKLIDARHAPTREATCAMHLDMLATLTGMDRQAIDGVDSEAVWAFMEALGDLIVKRWNIKRERRKQQQPVELATIADAAPSKALN